MPTWNLGKSKPECLPIKSPTVRDIAWAAGIYEGEGTCGTRISTYKPSNRRSMKSFRVITCRVSQKDSWLCPQLRDLFGGTVRTFKAKGREYYAWDLHGSRALGFLQTIYTFLSPRRQGQIRVILDAVRRPEELEN